MSPSTRNSDFKASTIVLNSLPTRVELELLHVVAGLNQNPSYPWMSNVNRSRNLKILIRESVIEKKKEAYKDS